MLHIILVDLGESTGIIFIEETDQPERKCQRTDWDKVCPQCSSLYELCDCPDKTS